MKRNGYALTLLVILVLTTVGCGNYITRYTNHLQRNVLTAYQAASSGAYSEAKAQFLASAQDCKRQSAFLGLLVRRSQLDKVNETLATLSSYATEDNKQDLGVETARACRQIEQLSQSFFGRF